MKQKQCHLQAVITYNTQKNVAEISKEIIWQVKSIL
jgi:uncharacterized protein YeaC (DUF1315 family)